MKIIFKILLCFLILVSCNNKNKNDQENKKEKLRTESKNHPSNFKVVWKINDVEFLNTDGNLVFVNKKNERYGNITAIDINTGQEIWGSSGSRSNSLLGVRNRQTSLIGDQLIYSKAIHGSFTHQGEYYSSYYFLQAIDKNNGDKLWKFIPDSPTSISSMLENENTLFYLDSWSSWSKNIVALDINTLEVKRKFKINSSSSDEPISANTNNVYFDSNAPSGSSLSGKIYNPNYGLRAFNINTGDLKWEFKSNESGDGCRCNEIIVDDDNVYFGSRDKHLYVLDANTGKEILRFKTDGTVGNPYIEDGVVYFGSEDGYLYAVDLKNGEKKWNFATKNKIVTRPVVYQSNIYVLSFDNFLYEVDIKSGKEKRRYNIVSGYVDPVVSNDGVVILVDKDGHIYALN